MILSVQNKKYCVITNGCHSIYAVPFYLPDLNARQIIEPPTSIKQVEREREKEKKNINRE